MCPKCNKYSESIEHLLQCKKIDKPWSKLINNTKELIYSNLELAKNPNADIIKDNFKKIMNSCLFYTSKINKFINSPQAFGIITSRHQNILTKSRGLSPKLDYFQIFIDAWLTVFYNDIWKERCNIIYNKKSMKTHCNPKLPFSKTYKEFIQKYPTKLLQTYIQIAPSNNSYISSSVLNWGAQPNNQTQSNIPIPRSGWGKKLKVKLKAS
jgi:hypothetical protein